MEAIWTGDLDGDAVVDTPKLPDQRRPNHPLLSAPGELSCTTRASGSRSQTQVSPSHCPFGGWEAATPFASASGLRRNCGTARIARDQRRGEYDRADQCLDTRDRV
jgi:hypothetical protein